MAAEPPTHSDEELVRSLQQRLKPVRGPRPKPHIVRAAIALARDDTLQTTTAWWASHGISRGNAQMGVLKLCDRLVNEGLLETETQSGPALASSPSPAPLLPEKLLVKGARVRAHARDQRFQMWYARLVAGRAARDTRGPRLTTL